MSAVFEAFGIKSVSPSLIKDYHHDLGRFFVKRFTDLKEDVGPAGWRGDAVEAGLNRYLYGRPGAEQIAAETFEQRSTEWSLKNSGAVHDDHDEEFAKVQPCLMRAIEAIRTEPDLQGIGVPSSYQQKSSVLLPGAPIPITGYWDWGFGKMGEGFTLDAKSSNIIPSAPEEGQRADIPYEHGIQFSCYAVGRGENIARALYVSSKLPSGGFTTKEAQTKTGTETRFYHKGTNKRLKHNPETDEGRAEIAALNAAMEAEKRNHLLVTLNADDIAFYTNAAVQALLSMETLLTAAIAMTEYECTDARSALARLCRPNFLARAGGHYDVWKADFAREAAMAVPEWGI